MDAVNKEEIALLILSKIGFLSNRGYLINKIENELSKIYSEIDDHAESDDYNYPIKYYDNVETIFDLIINGEINAGLYKIQSNSERAQLRKFYLGRDVYIKITRGSNRDYSQYWLFNFDLPMALCGEKYILSFGFTFRVGVRDTFPYEVQNISYLSDEEVFEILKLLSEE